MGLIIAIFFLSILLLIGSLLALVISLQRDKKAFQTKLEDRNDLKTILVLLNTYSGASRKHMAIAFVKSGITFIKGPFSNLMNFSKEQLGAIPTNEELDAAKIDLHIAELDAEIERIKAKKAQLI